ncbi:MAG: hypothetical protein OXE92_09410 [Bacteroidetes bacterium]|nr:hypothetical protein [Bacteroidota bacterium]MCY4205926.1 hypothetical protein [Bacteroidota bacterium]
MLLFILLVQISSLGEALTFHAPFDSTLEASVAVGDPVLYRAQGWDQRNESEQVAKPDETISIISGNGRYGGSLEFSRYADVLYYFKAMDNFSYLNENWNGTISFWLKLDPDQDLTEGQWCDPIQITSRAWDDGSVFVDFTRNSPRKFRFAAFADREIWNPDGEPWEEMAPGVMPMITVSDHPFSSDSWVHVVLVLTEFNTNEDTAIFEGYLNGRSAGVLQGRKQTLTWVPSDVLVQIGLQFIGQIDDLAFFNRNLSSEEVWNLYSLPEGIATLKK